MCVYDMAVSRSFIGRLQLCIRDVHQPRLQVVLEKPTTTTHIMKQHGTSVYLGGVFLIPAWLIPICIPPCSCLPLRLRSFLTAGNEKQSTGNRGMAKRQPRLPLRGSVLIEKCKIVFHDMNCCVKRPQDSFYSCQILAACWDLAGIIKNGGRLGCGGGWYCHRDEPSRHYERHSHYKTLCRKAEAL